MVNNKTTVMSVFKLLDEYKDYLLSEVMNTLHLIDSILKKNKDYLLSREVK